MTTARVCIIGHTCVKLNCIVAIVNPTLLCAVFVISVQLRIQAAWFVCESRPSTIHEIDYFCLLCIWAKWLNRFVSWPTVVRLLIRQHITAELRPTQTHTRTHQHIPITSNDRRMNEKRTADVRIVMHANIRRVLQSNGVSKLRAIVLCVHRALALRWRKNSSSACLIWSVVNVSCMFVCHVCYGRSLRPGCRWIAIRFSMHSIIIIVTAINSTVLEGIGVRGSLRMPSEQSVFYAVRIMKCTWACSQRVCSTHAFREIQSRVVTCSHVFDGSMFRWFRCFQKISRSTRFTLAAVVDMCSQMLFIIWSRFHRIIIVSGLWSM